MTDSAEIKKIFGEPPGELLLTHPVLNIPIHRGCDVEMFAGDPSRPYVARIEEYQQGRGLRCRWSTMERYGIGPLLGRYWRPYTDFGPSAGMPDIETATGRSLSSFGKSELLGGYKEDWNPPEAITGLAKVLPVEEWLKLNVKIPMRGVYYTRQIYSETEGCTPTQLAKAVLAPDPKGATSSMVPILHLQVINPEMRVYECRGCHKLYHPNAVPGVTATNKDFPSQSPVVFLCGGCGSTDAASPAVDQGAPVPKTGLDEKPSVEESRPCNSDKKKKRKSGDSPQSQEKRKQVAEKFLKSLLVGASEMKAAGLPMTVLEVEEGGRDEEECLRLLASNIEGALYDKHERSIKSKAYRAAYRMVNFNLSDPQNASLRRRVLTGEMSPQHLVTASHDELGSDSLKKRRLRQQEKYYKSQVLLERKTRNAESSSDGPRLEGDGGQSVTVVEETVKPPLPTMPEFGLPPSPDEQDGAEVEESPMMEIADNEGEEEDEGSEEVAAMEVDEQLDADMDEISDEALDELGSIEEDLNEDGAEGKVDPDGDIDVTKVSSLFDKPETRQLLEEALQGEDDYWSVEKTSLRLKERVEAFPAHLSLIESLRQKSCSNT